MRIRITFKDPKVPALDYFSNAIEEGTSRLVFIPTDAASTSSRLAEYGAEINVPLDGVLFYSIVTDDKNPAVLVRP